MGILINHGFRRGRLPLCTPDTVTRTFWDQELCLLVHMQGYGDLFGAPSHLSSAKHRKD